MKKISWGTGIVIAFIIFIIFSLGTTIFLMNQKVDLVEEDYYKKGIEYQKNIDMQKKSGELSEPVKFDFDGKNLLISFPPELFDGRISGEIILYRPSDSGLDIRLPISTKDLKQVIPVSNLQKGFWRVKLKWQYDAQEYYDESTIRVD